MRGDADRRWTVSDSGDGGWHFPGPRRDGTVAGRDAIATDASGTWQGNLLVWWIGLIESPSQFSNGRKNVSI